MPRLVVLIPLLLAILAPTAGYAQRGPEPLLYSASTGAMQNIPLVTGRTYTVEVRDLNPLCYSYSGEIAITEENTDLSKIVAAFGTLPGAAATGQRRDDDADDDDDDDHGLGLFLRAPGDDATDQEELLRAERAVVAAQQALGRLTAASTSVEQLVKEVMSPVCSPNASFAPVHARWESSLGLRNQVVRQHDLVLTRELIEAAQAILAGVQKSGKKSTLLADLVKAQADADLLETKLGTLVPDLLVAEGTMNAAAASRTYKTQAFLPANTKSAQIILRTTALKVEPGKKAETSELKTNIPVRRGMRVFLSAGFLASMAPSHDYARTNRPCPDNADFECEGVYSTYANRGSGRPFAFSPVLQVNVAFRDIFSSGASLHTSAGVAARSVNGSVSPEFILGAGAGLVDKLLLTAGIHIARDERLLIGDPGQVRLRPVSDKVTDADAVAVTWRPAFVLTTTVPLN